MLWDNIQQNRRKMISVAVIFFLMFVNRLFIGPFPKLFLNFLIWLTYTIALFIPKSWWTKIRIALMAIVVGIETAVGVFWFHEIMLIYLLAIVIFYVSSQLSLKKSPIPAMLAMLMTAIFYIRYGKEDLFSILSFLFFAIVLYFTIRIRMQRNEMYNLNQQQLVELQEAYEQLQEASVTSMQYAVLEERTRIAKEIHDAVGHSLTSLIVQMQALKYMIKKDTVEAEQSLENMLGVARKGLQDIRTSVHSLADNQVISGLTPLKALLSKMEAATGIRYTFQSEITEDDLTIDLNGILFRVLQEATTNIIRHSQASLVNVRLKKRSSEIMMCISDNGILDSHYEVKEGFGLKVMKERLEEIGGRLYYSILEPHGFEIRASIPIEPLHKKIDV
ncbi:MAG: sensor histidine kinase [Heyndrickxia sp.]